MKLTLSSLLLCLVGFVSAQWWCGTSDIKLEKMAKTLVSQGRNWNELSKTARLEFQRHFSSTWEADRLVSELAKHPDLVFDGAKSYYNPKGAVRRWIKVFYRSSKDAKDSFHQTFELSLDNEVKIWKVAPIKLNQISLKLPLATGAFQQIPPPLHPL
ncbi:MAG: hypothetical protein NUV80_07015 [Candidatus Berkelbacteria bacterium]|nr:hypothetical protein [Candidatus Berkelbacteria bacterium]